jgi:tRNA (guanine6-N2)-methyltransferase
MIPLFALTGRGLEQFGADELARLPGLRVQQVAYRRIRASYEGDPAALLDLKTVDDIFLELAAWQGLVPQRLALAHIQQLAAALPLKTALETIADFLPVLRIKNQSKISFSVTANFVGKRNYSSDEIKAAVAAGVTSGLPWRYLDENESQLNLRVFIEHDLAYVGLRLSGSPLHARSYKQAHISGSLKPSVAAAMLSLLDLQPGRRVLDPFCGAGTLPIEAALLGASALAGDRSPEALQAARANAAAARVPLGLCCWDGRSLPLPAGGLDCLAANLPWGRQVEVDAGLPDFYRAVCAEIERVLPAGTGQAVLLTSLPDLVRFERLSLVKSYEIGLFGQSPSILHYHA